MCNREVRSFSAAFTFSFVASALAAWAICAMAPTQLKVTSLPFPGQRNLHINHAIAAIPSDHEYYALEPRVKINRSTGTFEGYG
jgi:hypothetical protein